VFKKIELVLDWLFDQIVLPFLPEGKDDKDKRGED
jgi:hypothetical protein